MTHAALHLSLLALILTKVADIVTTDRGIRRTGSVHWAQNPLAHWAMLRFGAVGGIGFVMVLWTMVTAACYVPAWFASADHGVGWIPHRLVPLGGGTVQCHAPALLVYAMGALPVSALGGLIFILSGLFNS